MSASCSKKDSSVHSASTLHDEAVILESRLSWAKELDSKPYEYASPAKDAESGTGTDPVSIVLSSLEEQDVVYPSLPDFPVLDTTAYSDPQRACVENFCQSLMGGRSLDGYIMSGYAHTLVLFKYNLEKLGLSLGAVSDYALGKPFINERECQCPVRLYMSGGKSVDVNLYLAGAGQSWKIRQIEYKSGEIGR